MYITITLYTYAYTGTTGNPKGVELSHKNLISNVQGLNQRWAVSTAVYVIARTPFFVS